MTVHQLVGDCREQLRTLPADSVQACITSPPYYGLRDYGTDPLVWGGDASHEHEWHTVDEFHNRGDDTAGAKQKSNNGSVTGRGVVRYGTCSCGTWLGSLGLEPTPELFIEHLVEIFREVKRVLRPDGTLWVNLGDSYAGSGKGPSNSVQGEASQIGPSAQKKRNPAQFANGQAPTSWISVPQGLKSKDLMMMPARVALALQADGWWLRSMIPWLKRNSMPESVTDRPASAVEYVFLLSKSQRYYWDADAVRVEQSERTHERFGKNPAPSSRRKLSEPGSGVKNNSSFDAALSTMILPNGRNRRNSDWFFESWQGLMLDDDDAPLALVVNPQPFKESHFATFPAKLVEPLIKASTSERGQCPECGAPWVRIVEKVDSGRTQKMADGWDTGAGAHGTVHRNGREKGERDVPVLVPSTTGWRASCTHTDSDPIPQTVIDCFGGAGTVGLVADRLGRNAVLIDLKPDYASMAHSRITGDAPLFTEVVA